MGPHFFASNQVNVAILLGVKMCDSATILRFVCCFLPTVSIVFLWMIKAINPEPSLPTVAHEVTVLDRAQTGKGTNNINLSQVCSVHSGAALWVSG